MSDSKYPIPVIPRQSNTKLWSLPFLIITISNALLFLIFEMLLPIMPLYVNQIGGNATDVGLVTGIFMLSAIVVRPFSGYLLRFMDKKYLLIIGVAVNALATGIYYFANNVEILLVIRVLHGVGFGLATTYFATLVAEIIPKERRGEGIGYYGVGETVAISLGPMIGFGLLNILDFPKLFIGGMAVLLLSTFMIILTKINPNTKQVKRDNKIKFVEMKVIKPSLLIMLVGISASGIMSFFALYAIENGFNEAGWFFFTVAVASLLIRLISGKLFDSFGPFVILIPSALLAIMGFILLYLASSPIEFYIAAILYGFGFGAIFPALQAWSINLVQEHEHEYAMSTFFNSFDLGIGAGALLLGILATTFSYSVIYIVGALFYVAFLLFCIVFVYNQKKSKQKGVSGASN